MASKDRIKRLLASEPYLVALPLKPFGVLYFGRDAQGQPFTKAEASKLLFVAKRAESALVRAEKTARSEAALVEQTIRSERLEKQYALTSRLLEASQEMMAASHPQHVLEGLKTALTSSIPDCVGLVRLPAHGRLDWGPTQNFEVEFRELLESVLETNRPLHLPDLSQTRYGTAGQINSLMIVPLLTGKESLGLLVVGVDEPESFGGDKHDFICMLARLAAGAIESLGLTMELKQAHEQVVQASKLSAIGELAAGVAHELNTPLATLGLAIESAGLRPEKAAGYLADAERALEQAQSIVGGLLEHARQKDSDRVLVDLLSVVKDVEKAVKSRLSPKKQILSIEHEITEAQVLATPAEVLQILTNLVGNASDASPDASTIRLKLEKIESDIVLSIVDRGNGIADDIKGRIFDPFFTTKPVGKGTGLGLSVCRELAHRHHGKLNFQNNTDGGATFSLSFPARESDKHTILDH